MLYLNAGDIIKAMTFDAVMDSVEEALQIYEQKAFVMPDRMAVDCGRDDSLLLMPCVGAQGIATKIVTVFPGNSALDKPVIDALVMLNDRTTGEILALLEGKTITAMRTAAISGVSIRHLAAPEAASVGLVGCGAQGYYQLLFACSARPIQRIKVFDRVEKIVPAFVDRLQAALPGIEIAVATSPADLARAVDIIITATTTQAPVFPDDADLFKGKHLVGVGSFQPHTREYPDAVFTLIEKVWVDHDFASEESGELAIPLREGRLDPAQVETLGHFIASGREPERGAYGTTIFKTVGMALFDLTAARLAYSHALERGLGTQL